jgi:uncharacterized protein (TIGR02453 family)
MVRKRPAAQNMSYTFPVKPAPALTKDTIRFFRELVRNNNKPWMDANRDRYRAVVVEPLRALLDRLAPAARKLNSGFVITGRANDNFSRINRDIRFARDKTPYRPHMYLLLSEAGGEGGQLYAGVSADAVTCGFRIYGGGRTSPLVQFGRVRGRDNPQWIERQKRRFGKKYESYWYSTEKGEWTKHKGWPTAPEQWKKLQAWIVRRKFSPAAATRSGFEREVAKVFGDVYPFYEFTSSPKWKR